MIWKPYGCVGFFALLGCSSHSQPLDANELVREHAVGALVVEDNALFYLAETPTSPLSLELMHVDGVGVVTAVSVLSDPYDGVRENVAPFVLDGATAYAAVGDRVVSISIADGRESVIASEALRITTLTADGASLYYMLGPTGGPSVANGLMKLDKIDGTRSVLTSGFLAYNTTEIASDGASVYWACASKPNGSNDEIRMTSVTAGQPPITLATAQANPVAVAVSGAALFWLNMASGTADGALMTCQISACTPMVLVGGLTIEEGLVHDAVVADGAAVFWNDVSGLHGFTAGTVTDYAVASDVMLLASDSIRLFWATTRGIFAKAR